MKFTIITPTYNRWDLLERCIKSVLSQTYNNFEMIIIDDSTDGVTKNNISKYLGNEKIKYLKNSKNLGNNASKNIALENIKQDTDYIIFLDDDDWLNKDCLKIANEKINKNKNFFWYVSNRAIKNGESLTKNNTNKKSINYISDYLIKKKFSGDATHIINFQKHKNIRFSKKIKNAEEWFYFSQLTAKFYYYDFNSTFTFGYLNNGMTENYHKNKARKLKNTYKLFIELLSNKKLSPNILIYIALRIVAILMK